MFDLKLQNFVLKSVKSSKNVSDYKTFQMHLKIQIIQGLETWLLTMICQSYSFLELQYSIQHFIKIYWAAKIKFQ